MRTTTPNDKQIRTERVIPAPRARVWRAYAEPAELAKWWGRGHDLDVEQLELKPGGHWRFVEHAPEGDVGFSGEIREVKPAEKLVQTFGWDHMKGQPIVNTITFEDQGDATKIVVVSEFANKRDRDEMIDMDSSKGAEQSYKALEKVVCAA